MCNGLNKSEDTLFRKIESEKSRTYVENNYRGLKVKRVYYYEDTSMGERLFEANGQDNDTDFRRKNHPDTVSENKRMLNDQGQLPRYSSGNESCKWFEGNPQRKSRGSSDSLFTTKKTNEQYILSTDEGALEIDDRPANNDAIGQSNTALSRN